MSEVSGVRLVRCPKCENVLPEPPDVSVYQCGGCGAVLRAKMKGLLDGGISELSDEQKGRGISEKGDVNAGLVSDFRPERKSNKDEPGKTVERNLYENGVLNSNSSSPTDNEVVLANFHRGRRGTERKHSRFDENQKIGNTDVQYRHSSEGPNDNLIRDSSNHCLNVNRRAYINSSEFEEVRPLASSLRSRPVINQRTVDRNGVVDSRINANGVGGQRGFVNFPYPDDGPSNYSRGAYYDYGNQMSYADRSDGLARVEILEKDRADLLRKLDELADKLSRSFDVADKPKEGSINDMRIPASSTDSYGRASVLLQDGASILRDDNEKPKALDMHVSGPPHYTHSHGYVPYMDRHISTFQESYPSRNCSQGYQRFADVYQPPMLRRPSHQLPCGYFQESFYEQFPGHYADFNQDLFMSHPHEAFFHQPACSCLHCFDKNWHVPPKIQPPSLSTKKKGNKYPNRISHQHVNPVAYGPLDYNSEGSNLPQSHPRERHPLTRSSSDLGIENGGFGHRCFKKVVVAHGDGRVFHPIAGGAPFIACCNCYELLKLPRKLISIHKNQRKLKCGACSSILLFELERKGIVVSVPTDTEQVFVDVATATSEIPDENFQSSHDFPNTGAEDFNYNFQVTDVELNPLSTFDEPEMRQDPHSSSSSSSKDELSPDNMIVRKDVSHYAELLSKDACLPLPDSPLEEYPNHLSPDKGMHRNGQGYKCKCIDQDKSNQEGKPSRQNSLKDAMVATEMNVSYNDHSDTAVSRDFAEVRKVEDQPRINKGGKSFFVGLIKRSFGDFSRSSKNVENGRSNVSVNGHLIPDRVAKKAEKLAGPIQPGEYWYDFQAGFWGVMGHPCLGIIPPNIEEFNYPMPEDCAGGNSRVFVNGRELHQNDLDLLSIRGLPNTRHKRYLIEISGKVLDEDTGEELDGLGKLAPTVERANHGFGMKVPKSVLQQQCQS